MKFLKATRSICPECLKILDATIYEEEGQVLIKKVCSEHGSFKDVYWSNFDEFVRAQNYSAIGSGVKNPRTDCVTGHPFDCGLCPKHKSQTVLAIIDVTNRCNLRCPICFANSAVTGYVYEPTKDQINNMLQSLKRNKPIQTNALQFSGGEPTLRKDLPELVRMAKFLGFKHVEINTNGIRLSEDLDLCKELKDAGLNTVFLQFDGIDPEIYIKMRGMDLFEIKLKTIDNCRKSGLHSIVLVPTVVKGLNDKQLGSIIKFAAKNFDVVRCVNFQPVSITGRIDYKKRKEMRITIPDCMKLVENQTDKQIQTSDFYPVPSVVSVSRAVGALTNKKYTEFTAHEHCGMATFVFVESDKLIPINRYVNVDKFISSMNKVRDASNKSKTKAKLRMLSSLRFTKPSLIEKIIAPVLREGTFDALANLMKKTLMVSMMHFMDPYNFDLERLERCCIHYIVPPLKSGEQSRIIPFCAMNTIYRPIIEKELSISIKKSRQTLKQE